MRLNVSAVLHLVCCCMWHSTHTAMLMKQVCLSGRAELCSGVALWSLAVLHVLRSASEPESDTKCSAFLHLLCLSGCQRLTFPAPENKSRQCWQCAAEGKPTRLINLTCQESRTELHSGQVGLFLSWQSKGVSTWVSVAVKTKKAEDSFFFLNCFFCLVLFRYKHLSRSPKNIAKPEVQCSAETQEQFLRRVCGSKMTV